MEKHSLPPTQAPDMAARRGEIRMQEHYVGPEGSFGPAGEARS